METDVLLARLNHAMVSKTGFVYLDVKSLKMLVDKINSLERALADVLRLRHDEQSRARPNKDNYVDTRSW